MVKNPNISGIIHSIIRFVDCCRGSAVGIVVIFWSTHIDTPTRTGSTGVGSRPARSSHRKELFSGINSLALGSHE